MSSPGAEAWIENTTTFDRVQAVVMTLGEPQPVGYIADEAHVAETTARSHLDRLVKLDIVQETTRGRTSHYYPDPLYTRMTLLRDLFDEHDHDGLVEKRATVLEALDSIREDYGADSPTELRERAVETDEVADVRDLKKAASNWELCEFNLSLIDEAIRLYDAYATPIPGMDESGEGSQRTSDSETDVRLTDEQREAPGIADWVEATRIGRDLDPDR